MPLRPPLSQVLCRRRGQQLERRPLPMLVTYPEVRERRPGCWNQGPAPRLPKSEYAHASLAVLALHGTVARPALAAAARDLQLLGLLGQRSLGHVQHRDTAAARLRK